MGDNQQTVDLNGPGCSDGDTIGDRYRLGPVLGRGAMSTVYRAQDLLLGRDVAIKLFLSGSGDESFRTRQETEMRLLAAFDHPGLVAAFDAGVDTRNDEERAYLVMELAEGRDLRAVLSEGPLTVPETTRIGVKLAGALAQVHGHGVIHRDIKPANILVSEESGEAQSVKLADFGVALVMDDNRLTATGFTVGTAQYLSPEQAQGLHLTPASDIYSLGLVLLECITGRAEYPGTPVETASARLHRAPEVPEGLPGGLTALLRAMTDMDPGLRPAAGDVEEMLANGGSYATSGTAILPAFEAVPGGSAVAFETLPGGSAGRVHAEPVHASHPPQTRRARRRRPDRQTGTLAVLGAVGKRHPRVVGGVAAAAVTIPVALALLSQGVVASGTPDQSTEPAGSDVSIAEPLHNVPAAPDPVPSAEVVPAAEVASIPEPASVPVQVPAQQVQVPVQEAVPGGTGGKPAAVKSGGKSETKPGGGKPEGAKGGGRD
ncbi:serine/threonine-protein kinase [Paenarthrobacter sp. NyZ202]|uniref:serine/threonine-protein kinase n=1 Tax=Paenarthrobacter sp. NyZ202 TaxID=3402689 RepID=UPI003CF854EC